MLPLVGRLSDGMWAGHPAYVIGSGPSRRGLDLANLLLGKRTIGCNEEYRIHPSIAMCQDVRFFFGDGSRTPAKDNPDWYNGPSLPVFFKGHPDRPDPPYDDLGKICEIGAAVAPQRNLDGGQDFIWGRSLADGLYYGANCGLAALNLADILGADPIYLIGFDCAERDGRTSAHDHYPQDWRMKPGDFANGVFRMWAADFERIAPSVKGKVYNCCPWSGITCFEKLGAIPLGDKAWLAVG